MRPEKYGWVGGKGKGGGGVGELGCLRLYYKCLEKHGYFFKFWNFKIDYFLQRDNFIIIC